MSSDTCFSVFSKLTTVLSMQISWRRYVQEVNTFPYPSLFLHGLWMQMMGIVFIITDAFFDCTVLDRFTTNQLWGLILSKLSRFRFTGRLIKLMHKDRKLS